MELFANGKIKSLLTQKIGFEEIPQGLQKIKDGHAGGKIVAELL